MVAEGTFKARKPVRPRRTGQPQRAPDPEARDENGLTPWHYDSAGRQILCGTCDGRPCADRCPEPQFEPDTLRRKAARAGLPVEAWAAAHPDWVGWELHIDRPDVRAFLSEQALDQGAGGRGQGAAEGPAPAPEGERRRRALDVAMAQAILHVADAARAAEVAPATPESIGADARRVQ